MPDLTDLRTICSALEHFSLPAALGDLKDDALVFWNQAFQKRAGISDIELAQARLTSLILLEESYSGLALQHDRFGAYDSIRALRAQKVSYQ